MSIKGLTDRKDTGFPSLGKLRKGDKKVDEKRPGKDLPDYFRFTSDMPGVEEAFYKAYGEEPNELTFFFAYPEMEKNFDTCKEKWLAGQILHHRCDGEMCSRWLDEESGEYKTAGQNGVEAIPCMGGCKEVGRMEIVLPALVEAGFVGTVTVETHSINDLVAIDKALRSGEMLINQWGWRISQVPWFLYRTTKTIGRPRTASEREKLKSLRGTTDKSLLFVTPDSEWMAAQVKALQEHARAELPAPHLQLMEPNDQMKRETAVLASPGRNGGSRFLKAEDPFVTFDQVTGEIMDDDDDVPFSDEPEETGDDIAPWDDFEEKPEIPELSTKEDLWKWARTQFPDMEREELGDACRTVIQKAGTFEDAAKELLARLAA